MAASADDIFGIFLCLVREEIDGVTDSIFLHFDDECFVGSVMLHGWTDVPSIIAIAVCERRTICCCSGERASAQRLASAESWSPSFAFAAAAYASTAFCVAFSRASNCLWISLAAGDFIVKILVGLAMLLPYGMVARRTAMA